MSDFITVILLNWLRPNNIEQSILPKLLEEQNISNIIIAHCNPLSVFGIQNQTLKNGNIIKQDKIIHYGCFDLYEKYGTFCKWLVLNDVNKKEFLSNVVMSQADTFVFEIGEIKKLLSAHLSNEGVLISGINGLNFKSHEYVDNNTIFDNCHIASADNILGNKTTLCNAVDKIMKLNLPPEILKEEEILMNMFTLDNLKYITHKKHKSVKCLTNALLSSNCLFDKKTDIINKNRALNYLLNFNRVKCFCYWDKGIEKMPEMIRHIYNNNKKISEIYNFDLILITDENVKSYIPLPPMFFNLDPNYKSDIVRFTCLNKFGGMWIDADVIIIKDLNLLWKQFLAKKKDAILDIELNYKIGCASMLMLPNTPCSNFCYNYINVLLESHDITKNIKWDFLGPANVKLLYLTFQKNIILNDHNKVKQGCNFITWADKPGFIKDKWLLDSEALASEKANLIINNKECYYVITWTIYNKNDMQNIIDTVFNNKRSVFYYLTKNEPISNKLITNATTAVKIASPKLEPKKPIENKHIYKHYISIGAVFKQEEHALDEWIQHYLKLGVDHLYLINDFSTDNFQTIIDKYPYQITLFNNDIVTEEFGRQMQIYEKYLKPVLNETEYMAILDLDEFLYSPSQMSFKDFFTKYNKYSHYTISWINFGSNKQIDQPPTLIGGFTKRAEIKNNDEINSWGFKSMFKTNQLTKFGIHKHECHGDTLILDAKSNEFLINHYIIQSLLFYLEVKCTRGSATNFMNCPNKVVVEQQRKTRARFNVIDKLANSVLDNRLLFQNSYCIYKKIVVFVPYCEVYEKYIIKCLESIEYQNYPTYQVVIVNDGHSNTSDIDKFIKNKTNYVLINLKENLGPAHSKWRFIEYIQKNIENYNYNDIAMIVDGDDYIESTAFYLINKTYISKNCWFTYGNADGKFCQHKDREIQNEWDNVRKFSWIYNHPRTCKIHLLTLFKEEDFKINGKWLSKGTDRPFVYNCIEWSGKNRTQSLHNVIYQYIEHDLNSYKTVSYEEKQSQVKYIENLTPCKQIIEDIHIVMCCWKRIEFLELQIINLNNQTFAKRIHIHLLNNNKNNVKQLEALVSDFKKTYKIKISLSHYDNTRFGFQRFLYTRDVLMKNYLIDYVIFIDDDQLFYYDWVENIYSKREPKTYTCWYGRKWKDEMNYWTGSIINMTECRTNSNKKINEYDYGATCGCIIDVNIFNENTELWNVPKNLPKNVTVYNIEDLWLSHIIRYFYNWKIKRSFLPEKETINDNSDCNKHALFLSLYDEKQKLFEYLNKHYKIVDIDN